jgi:GNAT superfamily N-acetyltransferase
LDHNATAFCLFVGKEFANVGWVIFSAETKSLFDVIPYHVDFAHGEVCTGGSWTRPKFRGRGLATYNFWLRSRHLRHLGYVRTRCAIATTNKASLGVHAQFDPIIRARGWYVRLGKWRHWKESPLPPQYKRTS